MHSTRATEYRFPSLMPATAAPKQHAKIQGPGPVSRSSWICHWDRTETTEATPTIENSRRNLMPMSLIQAGGSGDSFLHRRQGPRSLEAEFGVELMARVAWNSTACNATRWPHVPGAAVGPR